MYTYKTLISLWVATDDKHDIKYLMYVNQTDSLWDYDHEIIIMKL